MNRKKTNQGIQPIGLTAATYTPMKKDGSLALDLIQPMVEHLISTGVEGLFVCGSTGEGMSLTTKERMEVAESFITAAGNDVPVTVHVGHNSILDSLEMAKHAESWEASAIAAIAPGFFKPNNASELVNFLAEIAVAAPNTPLYYYHFPSRVSTGIALADVLALASAAIPNLAGVKFTHSDLDELRQCRNRFGKRYHLLFGRDELFLESLQAGFNEFVGSTYNYAIGIFLKMREAYAANDLKECRRLQGLIAKLVELIIELPPFAGQKLLMKLSGFDCGPSRCPLPDVSIYDEKTVGRKLMDILDAV